MSLGWPLLTDIFAACMIHKQWHASIRTFLISDTASKNGQIVNMRVSKIVVILLTYHIIKL